MSNQRKEAWVFVVWGNPKYLIGAIVGAYSLRQQNTKKDIVLIHSYNANEVSPFRKLFNKILRVPITEISVVEPRTEKQRDYYGGYFSRTSITKWNCLDLVEYQKVCFIDSDIIANKPDMDSVFDLNTPAGYFDSFYSTNWVKNGIPTFYQQLYHGKIISTDAIRASLKNGGNVVAGGIVLLKPDGSYKQLVEWAKSQKYGHPKCFSGIDEQLITEWLINKGQQWKNTSCIYQVTPWQMRVVPEIHNDIKRSYGIHYMHDKPWENGDGQGWEDTKIWWSLFQSMPIMMRKSLSKYIDAGVLAKNLNK
jgi:glycogenin glucosyltransferase